MSYIIRNGAVVSTTLEHYDRISDKPYINNTLLDGVNTSESLGIVWKGTQEEYDALPIKNPNTVYFITDGEAGADTLSYNMLEDKPSINGVILSGDKTSAALNMYTREEIDRMLGKIDQLLEIFQHTGIQEP